MNNNEYQKLYNFENFYWWHIGRRHIIQSLLSKIPLEQNSKILDAGCGTGGNIKILSRFGKVVGIDSSPEAIKFCEKRGFKNVKLGNIENTDFSDNSFDLIVALDILEHLNNDVGALKEFHRILKKDGYILTSVPAYQFLWSEHDVALHHKRRYSIKGFNYCLSKANFQTVKKTYAIAFTAPVVFIYRIIQKIFPVFNKKSSNYVILPIPLNNFFIFLLRTEAFLLKYINFPFGISIIHIAKKNDLGK
jgi:SAM-dependent methyltransferase